MVGVEAIDRLQQTDAGELQGVVIGQAGAAIAAGDLSREAEVSLDEELAEPWVPRGVVAAKEHRLPQVLRRDAVRSAHARKTSCSAAENNL